MKTNIRTLTPFQRQLLDLLMEKAEEVKAVQDYNIMMGHLDDPSEEDE